jgi:hypothetical protein
MLIRDESARATAQDDSIRRTVSRPLAAIPHWDFITSILLDETRPARSRSAFIAMDWATMALEAASASAPTVKMRSPTTTSISVWPALAAGFRIFRE